MLKTWPCLGIDFIRRRYDTLLGFGPWEFIPDFPHPFPTSTLRSSLSLLTDPFSLNLEVYNEIYVIICPCYVHRHGSLTFEVGAWCPVGRVETWMPFDVHFNTKREKNSVGIGHSWVALLSFQSCTACLSCTTLSAHYPIFVSSFKTVDRHLFKYIISKHRLFLCFRANRKLLNWLKEFETGKLQNFSYFMPSFWWAVEREIIDLLKIN